MSDGVCNVFVGGTLAVLVAPVRTIGMAVAPVDAFDALAGRDAFELGRGALPVCQSRRHICI